MTEEKMARIKELAAKKKQFELTEEEALERAMLHQEYLASIRLNLERQLENIYLVDPDGTERKLRRKDEPEDET